MVERVPSLGRRSLASSRGWLLVGLIVLLSAVILALAGVTFYLTEHRRNTSLRQNQTKAIYLAQAGVMQAIYEFRRNEGITVGEQTVDAGPNPGLSDDDIYRIQPVGTGSTQSDFLLISMRGTVSFPTSPYCPASGRGAVPRDRLDGWTVRNVLASGGTSFVLQSFRVNWDPPGSEGILRLDLNGPNADWEAPGCVAAPRDTNISLLSIPAAQRTVNPGQRWGTNRVWLTSTAMETKNWIDVTFTMTDGSSRTARWDRVQANRRTADITIKSVGEVRRGAFPFVVWRRLQSEYRVCAFVLAPQCASEADERTQIGAFIGYRERTGLTP